MEGFEYRNPHAAPAAQAPVASFQRDDAGRHPLGLHRSDDDRRGALPAGSGLRRCVHDHFADTMTVNA